ncbi:spore germination protein GerPB [Paenibacillus sp. TAB 01]|uniref:spore germination protein GerPB n=1 Tax=Paenibacillus sp. TAB 01 TaxID=3368988 RepID=UPI003751D59D
MNFFINQNIVIHTFKVEAISNSSVLQIGSAGIIKPLSQLYNTGGFKEPAPTAESSASTIPFIPLTEPSL